MKNSLRYGLLIGIASGIWILVLHYAGVYEQNYPSTDNISILEIASGLIPLIGLYLGIKNFRDNIKGGTMEFFEGIMEGFKIIVFGGVISAFFAVVYVQYSPNALNTDYMARISAAVLIGILFNLVISLLLMNKQKHL